MCLCCSSRRMREPAHLNESCERSEDMAALACEKPISDLKIFLEKVWVSLHEIQILCVAW
jgi:hypothetical protein